MDGRGGGEHNLEIKQYITARQEGRHTGRSQSLTEVSVTPAVTILPVTVGVEEEEEERGGRGTTCHKEGRPQGPPTPLPHSNLR